MTRFVIKSPSGGLFTECDIVGTVESVEKDGQGNKTVFDRHSLKPRFDGLNVQHASKFDTAADAESVMKHPHLADPAAFSGCIVEPVGA